MEEIDLELGGDVKETTPSPDEVGVDNFAGSLSPTSLILKIPPTSSNWQIVTMWKCKNCKEVINPCEKLAEQHDQLCNKENTTTRRFKTMSIFNSSQIRHNNKKNAVVGSSLPRGVKLIKRKYNTTLPKKRGRPSSSSLMDDLFVEKVTSSKKNSNVSPLKKNKVNKDKLDMTPIVLLERIDDDQIKALLRPVYKLRTTTYNFKCAHPKCTRVFVHKANGDDHIRKCHAKIKKFSALIKVKTTRVVKTLVKPPKKKVTVVEDKRSEVEEEEEDDKKGQCSSEQGEDSVVRTRRYNFMCTHPKCGRMFVHKKATIAHLAERHDDSTEEFYQEINVEKTYKKQNKDKSSVPDDAEQDESDDGDDDDTIFETSGEHEGTFRPEYFGSLWDHMDNVALTTGHFDGSVPLEDDDEDEMIDIGEDCVNVEIEEGSF